MNKPSNMDPIDRTCGSESGPQQQVFHAISPKPYPSLSCCSNSGPSRISTPGNALVVFSFSLRPLRQVCGKEAGRGRSMRTFKTASTCPAHARYPTLFALLHVKRQLKRSLFNELNDIEWILHEKMDTNWTSEDKSSATWATPQMMNKQNWVHLLRPSTQKTTHTLQLSSNAFDAGY